jgi:hypothetical protein
VYFSFRRLFGEKFRRISDAEIQMAKNPAGSRVFLYFKPFIRPQIYFFRKDKKYFHNTATDMQLFPAGCNSNGRARHSNMTARCEATPYNDDSGKIPPSSNGVKQSMQVHWIASLRSQ